ncbi:MAG: hypothetical protein UW22_C0018G0019 [Candidatus Gottesmanbacteria bacterium GW2011_GWB1_44_11c]|uniref:Uncharacterized protein n=1 Tax=Candidatus Gottesmanbacteria bacterium GW2011_GWB1_44_11c TaxID=1618447 RepID=A0A0G1JQT4_9BACT|nr:MAG: hypothetical protein UW22_C0018G0019 [Candidatus Gottesmanbacteria bacterium GW2011_GWB1_44_11c]
MVLAPVVNAASTVIVPPVTLGYGVGVTAKTGDRIKKHATPAKNKTYALFKKRFIGVVISDIVLLYQSIHPDNDHQRTFWDTLFAEHLHSDCRCPRGRRRTAPVRSDGAWELEWISESE